MLIVGRLHHVHAMNIYATLPGIRLGGNRRIFLALCRLRDDECMYFFSGSPFFGRLLIGCPMLVSSRLSPARSLTSRAASSTVPSVLPSDGTTCNSSSNHFCSDASSRHRRYNLAIGVPVEVTAATIVLTYWDSSVQHVPLYTAIIVVRAFSRCNRRYSAEKCPRLTGLDFCN